MSGKTLAWMIGGGVSVALVIGVAVGVSTSSAVRPSGQVPGEPGPKRPESCAVFADVIRPDVPYETVYDPETSIMKAYGDGGAFVVDVTDEACRASSPLIDALARDALETWRRANRSECASTRRRIEAAGKADVIVEHGLEVDVDRLRDHAEEICAAKQRIVGSR